jgi:hypothetical protein
MSAERRCIQTVLSVPYSRKAGNHPYSLHHNRGETSMTKILALVVVAAFFLQGCASTTQNVALKDVITQRVYPVAKSKLFDAMRMYCPRYDFKLTGIEPESGRVRGFKKMETLREDEARTILMLVYIIALPEGGSRVEAKFVYDKIEGTPTRQEESQLVDCYTSLFRYLDNETK